MDPQTISGDWGFGTSSVASQDPNLGKEDHLQLLEEGLIPAVQSFGGEDPGTHVEVFSPHPLTPKSVPRKRKSKLKHTFDFSLGSNEEFLIF